jgi:hypothetical protein
MEGKPPHPHSLVQNHDLTADERSKGGKSLSPLKILANSVRRRKYCTVECAFADSCPVLPLAQSEWTDESKQHHPCKLRDAPPAIKRRIANMFLNGEEGLLSEIKSTLFVTSTKLADDNNERMQYADRLMKLHERIYGKEKTFVTSQEPVEIVVRQLNTPAGMGQEIKLTKTSERIVTQQDNALKLLNRNKPPLLEMDTDPESLFQSDKLDDIISYNISESEDASPN